MRFGSHRPEYRAHLHFDGGQRVRCTGSLTPAAGPRQAGYRVADNAEDAPLSVRRGFLLLPDAIRIGKLPLSQAAQARRAKRIALSLAASVPLNQLTVR